MKEAIKQPEKIKYAVLFIMAYSFMNRLPSEALPAVAGKEADMPEAHSVIYKSGDSLVLKLRTRKNKPAGSILTRYCTCRVLSHALLCDFRSARF